MFKTACVCRERGCVCARTNLHHQFTVLVFILSVLAKRQYSFFSRTFVYFARKLLVLSFSAQFLYRALCKGGEVMSKQKQVSSWTLYSNEKYKGVHIVLAM